jgi:putative phosphoesterase
MKILVFSDSHGTLSFMRHCVEEIQPDAVIHLGDHYHDGQDIQEEFPHIPLHQVPGNCDLYRGWISDPETRLLELGGVRLLVTHGHRHGVKQTLLRLLADARASKVNAVLFGHTHMAVCQKEDNLWVLNPGAASWGGSAGLITTNLGQIEGCRLIKAEEVKDL